MDTPASRPIVVAVDGSPKSASALRRAASEASQDGRSLRVVTACRRTQPMSDPAGSYWDHTCAAKKAARARAEAVIVEVLGAGFPLEHVVAPGSIERLLRDHSGDASSIVIGTRATDT